MAEAEQAPSPSVELERLAASARDALTDDMIARLSANAGQALDLLDRFNRSGIDRALPSIARLVNNGDLERLVGLARVFGAVEDSLSDDIVNRLVLVAAELAALVDKLARNEGFQRLMDLLCRKDVQDSLVAALGATDTAKSEADKLPPPAGGIGGLWQIATDKDTQEALRFMALVCKQLNKG